MSCPGSSPNAFHKFVQRACMRMCLCTPTCSNARVHDSGVRVCDLCLIMSLSGSAYLSVHPLSRIVVKSLHELAEAGCPKPTSYAFVVFISVDLLFMSTPCLLSSYHVFPS